MVKCKDCGLVALRHTDSGEFHEVYSDVRESGEFTVPGTKGQYHDMLCFARSLVFPRIKPIHGTRESDLANVLREERDCGHFVKWDQGFSPKEHVSMQLLKEQRDWQRQMADDDRRWRERQDEIAARRAEDDRRWREQQEENVARRHDIALRSARRVSVGTALIGAAAALATAALTWALAKWPW